MIRCLPIVFLIPVFILGCSPGREIESTGILARFGNTPTIDGIFEPGEWNDAEIVRADTIELFRIKHDGSNLYFAVKAGGGDLLFNMDAGVRVLHWSAQLGSAEYLKTDTSTQVLDKPYAFELWDLQKESPSVIQEALAGYLVKNGWVANTASMGNLMQSELAVSFDWLGINPKEKRFAEIPGVHICGGLMIVRSDPRAEELMKLSREEVRELYPPVSWPLLSPSGESICMGGLSDTIHIDEEDFGRIFIDLHR